MKQTIVLFDRVGDCPHWIGTGENGCNSGRATQPPICCSDKRALPPDFCPCEEYRDNIEVKNSIPNTTKATICPVCGGDRYIIGKLSYSKHKCSSCNGSGKQ